MNLCVKNFAVNTTTPVFSGNSRYSGKKVFQGTTKNRITNTRKLAVKSYIKEVQNVARYSLLSQFKIKKP